MSRVPKMDDPLGLQDSLVARAQLYKAVRVFFEVRGVLEVETPIMGRTNSPDKHIDPFVFDAFDERFVLQTSPEFFMKRLLAQGVGDIYQISKVFRQGESGARHNPEFTMLEWYRVGWDHHALIDEVEALLDALLGTGKATHYTYQDLFQTFCGFDPFDSEAAFLEHWCHAQAKQALDFTLDYDGWLDYIMTHHIEPKLDPKTLYVIKHFPSSQAALSKIHKDKVSYAERFEFYYQGVELANGYHELNDPAEQRARFQAELDWRQTHSKPALVLDEKLLSVLDCMPDCAGVALGLDRVLMLQMGVSALSYVLPFPHETL